MNSKLAEHDENLFTLCYEVVMAAGAMAGLSDDDSYKIATDIIKASLVSVGDKNVILNYEARILVLKACCQKAIELLAELEDIAKQDTQDQVRLN